jgi:endonuclease YncB( thermonuclease family)
MRRRFTKRPSFLSHRRISLGTLAVMIVALALGWYRQHEALPVRTQGPAGPETTGRARIIDGDTIEIAGTRIRLYGIDAPEKHQFCQDGSGERYGCGQRALNALEGRIDGQTLVCEKRDIDRYGRTVAVCRQGTADINAWMVETGWAVAYRRYSGDYVAAEDRARAQRVGIWAGSFENPADWRRDHRR